MQPERIECARSPPSTESSRALTVDRLDYPAQLTAEIAELLAMRGFGATASRYFAAKIVAHGTKGAAEQAQLIFYEVLTEASLNLDNRAILDARVYKPL